ncbi:hypothetical protein, partial [Mediterraneibacter gnavus]|uniref:hypothetical protein n=1 Tax=Mediterraneibacter gnavus TaxID=33038 RepID=UPI001FAC1441
IPLFQDLFYYALKMKNKFVIVCLIIAGTAGKSRCRNTRCRESRNTRTAGSRITEQSARSR